MLLRVWLSNGRNKERFCKIEPSFCSHKMRRIPFPIELCFSRQFSRFPVVVTQRRFAASGAGGDIRLRRSPALLKTAADAAFLTAYPQPAAAPRPKDDCGAAALCVAAHNHYAILFRLAMFLLLSSQVFAHFIYHFFLRMCRDAYIRGSLLLPRKNYAQRRNAALGAIKRNRG